MSKKHKHIAPRAWGAWIGQYGGVLAVIACNLTLFGWIKSDVAREVDHIKGHVDRIEGNLQDFTKEVRGWREEMHKQTSDFNSRLSVTECKVGGIK